MSKNWHQDKYVRIIQSDEWVNGEYIGSFPMLHIACEDESIARKIIQKIRQEFSGIVTSGYTEEDGGWIFISYESDADNYNAKARSMFNLVHPILKDSDEIDSSKYEDEIYDSAEEAEFGYVEDFGSRGT